MNLTRLSIVIPVYRSESTISDLCRELIRLYADLFPLEIILVNDCSPDDSDRECRKLHDEFPETIVYVRLAKNFGEHNAVMAGLRHVTGDIAVTMDDDFQNPPSEVKKLVDALMSGSHDVVYAQYSERSYGLFRNFGAWFNDTMSGFVLKKPKGIYLASFRAMNRFLVNQLEWYDRPDPYIDGIILRTTSNIGKVTVDHHARSKGSSNYSLGKLIGVWGNMMVSYSLVPIRILGLIGTCMFFWGMIEGITDIFEHIHPQIPDPSDFDKLRSTTVFFRGFQLLATSLVAEYVGRIYLAMNHDPQFVVREIIRRSPSASEKGSSSV